jgi:uncharacterized protein (UPF0332 family)
MNPDEFLNIAELIPKIKEDISLGILYRTAINRLYYGVFHLVQLKLKIFIPNSEKNRCHAFVKSKIENSRIRSDYAELEVHRVKADYELSQKIDKQHYRDALRLQRRIINRISEPKYIPYDEDEDFYFKHKQ